MNYIDDKRLWGGLAGLAILILLWMWLSAATLPSSSSDSLAELLSASQKAAAR